MKESDRDNSDIKVFGIVALERCYRGGSGKSSSNIIYLFLLQNK